MKRILLLLVLTSVFLCTFVKAEICSFFRNGQHQGRIVEVDLSDSANVNQLTKSILPIAKLLGLIRFDAPSEFDLVDEHGTAVSSILDCPKHHNKLHLIRKGDVWIYPGINKNHQETINLSPSHNVTLTTLSLSPKVLLIDNLLSPEECKQLIQIAKEQTAKTGLKLYTLTAENHALVTTLEHRFASLLQIPVELALGSNGLEVSVNRPTTTKERVLIAPKRDFTLKPDYEFLREELDRGRNTLASISFFLETDPNGGIFFPLISDSSKKMVKFSLDGSMQVNIDPTLKACDHSGGLYIPAKQGSAVLYYHLLPDGVMNGKIDPNTLYQYCTDQERELWTMSTRIPNKTWYSATHSPFLQFFDVVFSYLFGTDFTKAVMMNGYGWDWHENPRGHFSHKVEDLAGKHKVNNQFGAEPGQAL